MNKFIFILIIMSLLLTGCATNETENKTLKIAVMTTLDALPIYAAEKAGYYAQNGVNVEIIPVSSAPERDQLMQSGQIDGMVTELVSTLAYNQKEIKVVVVRFSRVATKKSPVFRILAAKDSGIKTVNDLKGVEIGISEGTVIEYTTDRILQKAGLTPDDIKKIAVPKIPDRLAMLESGQLKAANLPEPTASLAIQKGSILVIDDTSYPEISHSVLTFNVKTVKQSPELVRGFLKSVDQAVKDINADKTKWSGLLSELKVIPAPLMNSYQLPDFPLSSVPSEAQFKDALEWAKAKNLVKVDLAYNETVDASFITK